jgi:uncharacterized membrane protein YdjX (TVP38/TMEM64 family)
METADPLVLKRQSRARSIAVLTVALFALLVYLTSGVREITTLENLRELGKNPLAPALIIAAMMGAWAFALPASIFFFITPLLFPPEQATLIICVGSAAGTAAGYWVARIVGGPWIEPFREYRVTKFLERHSSFASLFAIRVFPSSPHGWINYGAGLLRIPFPRFLAATVLGVGIKAFLYATAIEGSVGASSIREALNWKTVTALTVLSVLALVGHVLRRKWMGDTETKNPAG